MDYVQPLGDAPDAPYIDGNPALDIEGSVVPAAAIEHPQREIMAVITGVSIAPDPEDLTQLRQAITKMIQAGQRAVVIDNVTFAGGVVTGNAVYWDSPNTRFDKAQADGTAKQNCVGFADVANSKVYCFGDTILFSGLTPGSRYYLDAATAGAITTTPTSGGVYLGIAKSATEMFVDIDGLGVQAAQNNTFTKAQRGAYVALASASGSIAINLADANNFKHTFTENTVLTAPSGVVGGQAGVIEFVQHAASAKTLAYNAFWKFADGVVPAVSSTPSAKQKFFYVVDDDGLAATCVLMNPRS